jgi:hypothetical protein
MHASPVTRSAQFWINVLERRDCPEDIMMTIAKAGLLAGVDAETHAEMAEILMERILDDFVADGLVTRVLVFERVQ